MSKESIIKKRLEKQAKENPTSKQPSQPKKPRIARPLIQRPVRRLNRRFIITFAIWLIALGVALYFISR